MPGVVILELCWAQVAERGVESAAVVDLIDEVQKVGGHALEGFVIHQIDRLDFKRLHEALGLGIVIGIATSARGADETMFDQQAAIGLGGVLRTAIRPYSDSCFQRGNGNSRIDRAADR
jgi:hypothetical protein